ncbi:MAG: rhodanese-like domain-containing protein [Gammaproteobacteria bacterium]|nr:rhodanese-like domain-containing protein [Gammaproteobacteria bacterium]NIM72696.1 rhodanese-like domain-containing protein [Gammaproteobacteria bacterium]NIN37754.1 rhodanese-like domain-containing protein [Gammaproteobacteria bacterium]NIO24457.1 rhodanese-like domain-containing protein [Gammaproteobacteria bacterium]NIO65060.1 rhodanese-like domain-containing protein [Gammaproteobacteria bacterium]
MPKGFKDYLAEANARVETCSVQDAMRLHGRADWIFVDVRDAAELATEGKIPQAVHASRGLLEFRIDPASPMHDPGLAPAENKRFVFYCGTGGRSALAAERAMEMGLGEVISMAGGFNAWKAAGGPVEGGG